MPNWPPFLVENPLKFHIWMCFNNIFTIQWKFYTSDFCLWNNLSKNPFLSSKFTFEMNEMKQTNGKPIECVGSVAEIPESKSYGTFVGQWKKFVAVKCVQNKLNEVQNELGFVILVFFIQLILRIYSWLCFKVLHLILFISGVHETEFRTRMYFCSMILWPKNANSMLIIRSNSLKRFWIHSGLVFHWNWLCYQVIFRPSFVYTSFYSS